MPRPNRGEEILNAIRRHLEVARTGPDRITDKSLMAAAKCSGAPFYKYVTKGSKIWREIEEARRKQRENAGGGEDGQQDKDEIIRELRKELDRAREGNRELLGNFARLIKNLVDLGVSNDLIQAAQDASLEKPDRSVSQAGRSRRKKR